MSEPGTATREIGTAIASRSTVHSILLVTCGGEDARRAVAVTDGIAARSGCIIRVVGAAAAGRDDATTARHGEPHGRFSHAPQDEAHLWRVRGEIAEDLREVTPDAARWSGEVLEVDPAQAIAIDVRHFQPDLIVISGAKRGNSGCGLATEEVIKLLRHTRVPVLIVPPASHLDQVADTARGARMARALVATDFGDAASRASELALDIMAQPGTLVLAHVEPLAGSQLLGPAERRAAVYRAALPAQFASVRASLSDRVRVPDVEIDAEILTGEPVAAIRAAAEGLNVDLIAVGTRSLSALNEWALGSVSAGLVRAALTASSKRPEWPLLVAPSPRSAP